MKTDTLGTFSRANIRIPGEHFPGAHGCPVDELHVLRPSQDDRLDLVERHGHGGIVAGRGGLVSQGGPGVFLVRLDVFGHHVSSLGQGVLPLVAPELHADLIPAATQLLAKRGQESVMDLLFKNM